MYPQKSPIFPEKSHIYLQKSSIVWHISPVFPLNRARKYAQKSPIYPQNCPIYPQKSHTYLQKTPSYGTLRQYSSSKQADISAKEP